MKSIAAVVFPRDAHPAVHQIQIPKTMIQPCSPGVISGILCLQHLPVLFLAGCGKSKPQQLALTVRLDSVATAAAIISDAVQLPKGPIMTVLSEFYKMGPGPSSLIQWARCESLMIFTRD